ncbi:MAG TPA: peptidase C39 family protein [Thermomicrobiaceae bacterium]|nr:peptidase C39 family protein [Thermomicrobiaceae bacterium]
MVGAGRRRGARRLRLLPLAILLAALLPVARPAKLAGAAAAPPVPPYVGLRLDAQPSDFAGDSLAGVAVDSTGGEADVHLAGTGWTGGQASTVHGSEPDRSGTLLSVPLDASAPFDRAIVSWDARTPAGSWLQVELRAYRPDTSHWTAFYTMGIWASDGSTIQRHSVAGQADADGSVATDTLRLTGGPVYTRYQYRLTLFTVDPSVSPHVSLVAVMTADSHRDTAGDGAVSSHAAWGTDLAVPQVSQMLYPNGGEVWCSPTSVAMVLGYWGDSVTVPDAAAATYDATYQGTGNWPFNTAFASTYGLEAYVTRLGSMADLEAWIAAGIPVVISVAYGPGALPGSPIPASDGHLLVVRGFDAAGNVITNDPAASTNTGVRIVYDRATLERLWLASSGGTVYLIYPRGHAVPATVSPAPATDSIYFPETGHSLSNGFKAFWEQSGGLPVFGYPLTEEFRQPNPDNGQTYTVQYFERQRFEYHPESAGTPYAVELGRLGVQEAKRLNLLGTAPFQPVRAASDANCTFFPETGHRVCFGFRDYWQSHGLDFGDPGISFRESLALFGYPISEEFQQNGMTVQYFERAVFEYHPENAGTPYTVLLRRLGAEALAGS